MTREQVEHLHDKITAIEIELESMDDVPQATLDGFVAGLRRALDALYATVVQSESVGVAQ